MLPPTLQQLSECLAVTPHQRLLKWFPATRRLGPSTSGHGNLVANSPPVTRRLEPATSGYGNLVLTSPPATRRRVPATSGDGAYIVAEYRGLPHRLSFMTIMSDQSMQADESTQTLRNGFQCCSCCGEPGHTKPTCSCAKLVGYTHVCRVQAEKMRQQAEVRQQEQARGQAINAKQR